MRIDLPLCSFKDCRHNFDGNYRSEERKEKCEFDVYKKAFEEQPKIGGWIPCSERLPEEERFCIVTYKFDDEENYKCHELYYGVADGENDAGWYIDDDCERLYKPFTVIAWQPLPEVYRG